MTKENEAEALLFEAERLHDIRVTLVRIFNTFGPNMEINDGRVVTNLSEMRYGEYRLPFTEKDCKLVPCAMSMIYLRVFRHLLIKKQMEYLM